MRRPRLAEPGAADEVGSVQRLATWVLAKLAVFEKPVPRTLGICLGVLLVLPSALSGLALDDYILLYMRRPGAIPGVARGPFDLFVFYLDRWLVESFGLPWWSLEQSKSAFMRPVSSLTHAVDAWLWPDSPALMHLQSIAWFALVVALASRLYGRLEGPWIAGVASVLFALDDTHGLPVGWIANRNALIGATFGIGALIAHDRARASGRLAWGILAALCFGVGLLSAELALGTAAYLFGYALFLDDRSVRQRVLSLLPYALILGTWAFAYIAFGYGTYGLGSYLNPLRDTAAFLRALPERWTLLMASQFGAPPAEFWILMPIGDRPLLLLLDLFILALGVSLVWPSLRTRRSSRFWATGAALSILPGTATMPNDRLLVFVGLGGIALVAQGLHDTLDRVRQRTAAMNPLSSVVRLVIIGVFLVLHFVVATVSLPIRGWEGAMAAAFTEQADATVPKSPPIDQQAVIVTHVSASLVVSYLPIMRLYRGEPIPKHLYWLAATPSRVLIERPAENVLRLRPEGGFLSGELERHYRGMDNMFSAGDRVELAEMTVTILELTSDGRPAICEFRFRRPLESRKYVWLTWTARGLVPFELPPVGKAAWSSIGTGAPLE